MTRRSTTDRAGRRRALITGSQGFIGRALCERLIADDWQIRRHSHEHRYQWPENQGAAGPDTDHVVADLALLNDLAKPEEWQRAVDGVDVVFHLAGIAHRSGRIDPSCFDRINHRATLRLAELAAASGVRRFVFVSSINAMGEQTTGAPFKPNTPPAPVDPYGRSKLDAEHSLLNLVLDQRMEVCIVRPPLVFGPGAKGNLLKLMRWITLGRPVPVASPPNTRSMTSLHNLVNVLLFAAIDPAASGRVLLPADVTLSTEALAVQLGSALGRPVRLIKLNARLLDSLGQLTRLNRLTTRLTSSLVVSDPFLADQLLDSPSLSAQESLTDMARFYLETDHTQ